MLFPMSTESPDITQLLRRWSEGEPDALEQVLPLLYAQLRFLAHQRRNRLPSALSLNTTALVHEAYLKLAGSPGGNVNDRSHFLAIASRVMRNVLVDHARTRRTAKRGSGAVQVELKEDVWISHIDVELVTSLDDALKKLESVDARQGLIVEQHYFGGMTVDEIAAALELSSRTVKRELRSARAWLSLRLSSSGD